MAGSDQFHFLHIFPHLCITIWLLLLPIHITCSRAYLSRKLAAYFPAYSISNLRSQRKNRCVSHTGSFHILLSVAVIHTISVWRIAIGCISVWCISVWCISVGCIFVGCIAVWCITIRCISVWCILIWRILVICHDFFLLILNDYKAYCCRFSADYTSISGILLILKKS